MATFTFPLNPQVGNTYTVGSRTYRWTGYAWSIVTGTITTGNTAVTGNSVSTTTVTTGNTSIADAGLTTGNTSVTNTGLTTGNTSITSTGLTTGNTSITSTGLTAGNTSITSTGLTTGNTSITSTGLTTGNTSITSTGLTAGNTSITSTGLTTGNTSITSTGLTTGNTSITSTGLTTGNTTITGNSISTDSLFYANGNPYVTNSNIYNGLVSVAMSLVMIDYAPIAGTTTVRWLLSATDNVNNRFKFSTIDCINNGTAAFFTEYAVLLSHPTYEVANYASNVTSGNIDLYAIGDSANVTITYQRTTLGSSTQVGYLLQ